MQVRESSLFRPVLLLDLSHLLFCSGCNQTVLHIFSRVQKLGKNYQLTASAIELSSLLGNIDLMVKVPENRDPKVGSQVGSRVSVLMLPLEPASAMPLI